MVQLQEASRGLSERDEPTESLGRSALRDRWGRSCRLTKGGGHIRRESIPGGLPGEVLSSHRSRQDRRGGGEGGCDGVSRALGRCVQREGWWKGTGRSGRET